MRVAGNSPTAAAAAVGSWLAQVEMTASYMDRRLREFSIAGIVRTKSRAFCGSKYA
ncbi:hypothetical protein D3C83_235010 [compost metagenome]